MDRENEFSMVLGVVSYIPVLVVHGLGRSMRFSASLVQTTYVMRVGYITCAYLSCSQDSEEASAFIRP